MRNLTLIAGAAASTLLMAGCERDEIVSVDPGEAPGTSAATVEALLDPGRVISWTDTVFDGFTGPSGAAFLLVEEGGPDLMSRSLVRFAFSGDSVDLGDTISAVLAFDSARVVVNVDTLRSSFAAGGTTVQLRELEQNWDDRSASWDFAVDTPGVQVPWTTPGGSLGSVLSETLIEGSPDSVVFPLGAASDSLLDIWADSTQVNTGLAMVVADSGRLVANVARLRFLVVPEVFPDSAVEERVFVQDRTFIFDRSVLALDPGVLRIGGVTGFRAYVEIGLPDSLPVADSSLRVRLRGSIVNRAELALISRARPPEPFAAESEFTAVAFNLLDDLRTFGPKTPVGQQLTNSDVTIEPDSLGVDEVVRIDLTSELQRIADTPADSALPPLRLALRARPEASTFGFWEFGAADGEADFVPVLRVLFTPPTEFPVP